jgi:hypothetical protein
MTRLRKLSVSTFFRVTNKVRRRREEAESGTRVTQCTMMIPDMGPHHPCVISDIRHCNSMLSLTALALIHGTVFLHVQFYSVRDYRTLAR